MAKFSLDEWKKDKEQKQPKVEVVEIKKPEFISNTSQEKHKGDDRRFRHARERHEGFKVGYYNQTPPMIFTRDGHNVFMGDMYRGSCAFLFLGGPSTNQLNLDLLERPGVLTMGVNNAVKTFRPNLWLSVDRPESFMMSIWLDATITKFVPICHAEKTIFDNIQWTNTDLRVGDCPNVFYFRRNEHFQAEQFLLEDTFNWGNHSDLCHCGYMRPNGKKTGIKITVCPDCGNSAFGSRSVMLPAVRMLYFLGVRTIFLIGCDFNMEYGKPNYSFPQGRSEGSVNGNNSSYKMLEKRFEELNPIFRKLGLCVFNCNPDSKLEVFPKVAYTDAIKVATSGFPDTINERSDGMYDRSN